MPLVPTNLNVKVFTASVNKEQVLAIVKTLVLLFIVKPLEPLVTLTQVFPASILYCHLL